MEKVGLEDGMSWKHQKNYDNTRIDMTVTMKQLLMVIMIVMLAVVIAMVRNNICFLQVEAIF